MFFKENYKFYFNLIFSSFFIRCEMVNIIFLYRVSLAKISISLSKISISLAKISISLAKSSFYFVKVLSNISVSTPNFNGKFSCHVIHSSCHVIYSLLNSYIIKQNTHYINKNSSRIVPRAKHCLSMYVYFIVTSSLVKIHFLVLIPDI